MRQEESFGFSPSLGGAPATVSPAQHFATILREGADVGVHTLLWCDTVTNLIRTPEHRALQMSEADSAALLDSPAASKPGANRAIFYSEDEGRVEELRPYGLPDPAWLAAIAQR